MRIVQSLYALNRGVVSRLGLARSDVKRAAMAAETQTNWMPRVLGSMMLRPGTGHKGGIYLNAAERLLKFIFATDDTALLEFTALAMRVWINDVVLTRPAVTTAITNGTFAGSLAGWTSLDEAGGTSAWAAGNLMSLTGNGTNNAIREQQVAVAGLNIGVEHGIRITIYRGDVMCRIGTASGLDDYLSETTLSPGTHSISITPTGNFYLRFFSTSTHPVYVQSATIEAAGAVVLPTPYAAGDLGNLRQDQSGDVLFVACKGKQQHRIERRGTRPNSRSWSVVLYQAGDGPFNLLNTSSITITPSALTGNVTLTASKPIFSSDQVGGLYAISSTGQAVTKTGAANGDATPTITITGVGSNRQFGIVIVGDASGSTVDLQQSYDGVSWVNVAGQEWTADISTVYADGLANQIIYYRLILTTRVAPDSVIMAMSVGSGSIRGVARITAYNSATSVAADVLQDMGQTTSSTSWQEGMWSDKNGWPTAVSLHEGRLWWAGINGIWGSISDAYDSFDETFVGNAGPINRTIGSGPVDTINWLMSLKGLIVGAQGTEYTVRASSLDEPLTPTNFNVKGSSTQGSGAVDAVKIDQSAFYVNRAGVKVFGVAFNLQDYDYNSNNLMELAPDIGRPGIVRMDVQRLPDTRIHCVRSDGTAVVAVMNKAEDVLAWIPVESPGAGGLIEDVVVLPAISGESDDQVYYVVKRTINGSTVRYLEKWAQEIDCLGDKAYCYLADSFVAYSGVATTLITGLDHLEGQQVVVWADGLDVGTIDTARPWTQTYTVAGGQITLAAAASDVVVGLPYTAQYKSAKLGAQINGGTPLNQQKKVSHIGFVAANLYPKGLKFGPTLDDTGPLRMDDMPEIEKGTDVGASAVTDYDENLIEFPGTWTTDSRVCLQAQAPRPATVLAITVDGVQNQ